MILLRYHILNRKIDISIKRISKIISNDKRVLENIKNVRCYFQLMGKIFQPYHKQHWIHDITK